MAHRFEKYSRRCRRCENIYTTTAKQSRVCKDCYLPLGAKKKND